MSRFFKSLLGFVILISTIGLATCQSLVKAETMPASRFEAKTNLIVAKVKLNQL